MSMSIYIDQQTQDLQTNAQGQLVNQNSLLTEMYCRISMLVSSYRYDTTLGSLFQSFVQNRQIITVNKIKNTIIKALIPMTNRGSIINIDFVLIKIGIAGFAVNLNVTDSEANTFSFKYSVKG